MFISNIDLSTVLDTKQLSQVITPNDANRKRAEQFALEEVKAYLNFRYDIDLIFGFQVFDYSTSDAYLEGQVIIDSEGVGYTCIANAPAATPLTNTSYFEVGEGRNPIIVMITTDLMAYHLFSKNPANRIPQHIIDRYEQAIEKLKNIRSQKMNPLLPLKVEVEGQENPNAVTQTVSIISNEKRNNYYD